jgi:hypothetical protein
MRDPHLLALCLDRRRLARQLQAALKDVPASDPQRQAKRRARRRRRRALRNALAANAGFIVEAVMRRFEEQTYERRTA